MSSTTLKIAFHNLGCKVNSYETEVMLQRMKLLGHEIVSFDEPADVYIVNTCSVTNIADRKSRQMLHKARRQNPDAIVVAVGCYVQSRYKGEDEPADGVDLIIGNDKKGSIAQILEEYIEHKKADAVGDISLVREYEPISLAAQPRMSDSANAAPDRHESGRTRAYIKVEDGCNNFCSYCIIPYVRGRVRSRKSDEVIKEVRTLADAGYREIVLTGINLSAYGQETGSGGLSGLVEKINEVDGIERIRISSLEPRIVTGSFAKALASMKKVCPHFHLSLQSGCDETLRRMNRHYTSAEYEEAALALREEFYRERGAYPALTTDVIVGFPGESEEDFLACEDFLKRIKLFETHVFKFSRREGTPAAKMKEQLTERVKSERSARLLALNEINRRAYTQEIIANESYMPELLVEERFEADGMSWQIGHTGEYIRAMVRSDEDLIGKIVAGRLSPSPYKDGGREICIMDI